MQRGVLFALFASAFAMVGCARNAPPPRPTVQLVEEDVPEWMRIASSEDQDRLARVAEAWTAGLQEARRRGFRGAINDEGELLDPAIALPRAAPPPGSYHCRVIKLGTRLGRGTAYNAYKSFFCYVDTEGDVLTITKQTGTQRPAGRLYPDRDERHIFLGTLALGDEEAPLPYGENPDRDMVGVMERVAPFRYRLAIPWPRRDSKLDVIELVPAL